MPDTEITNENGVVDLLYERSDGLWQKIARAFPNAKLRIADDEIKGPRTAVEILHGVRWEWFKFLLENGLHPASLNFQLAKYSTSQETIAALEKAVSSLSDK